MEKQAIWGWTRVREAIEAIEAIEARAAESRDSCRKLRRHAGGGMVEIEARRLCNGELGGAGVRLDGRCQKAPAVGGPLQEPPAASTQNG